MIKKIKKYIKYIQKLLENDKRFINNEEYKFKYKIKSIINNIESEDDPIYDDLKIDITNLYNPNDKKKYIAMENNYIDILNKYTNLKDITLKDLSKKYTDVQNNYTNLHGKYTTLKTFNNELAKKLYDNIMTNNEKLLLIKDLLLKLSSK